MTLGELKPDVAFKNLIVEAVTEALADAKAEVEALTKLKNPSEDELKELRWAQYLVENFTVTNVYAQSQTPNYPTPDYFIRVEYNGFVEPFTKPIGGYRGFLMVPVNIPCEDDSTMSTMSANLMSAFIELVESCFYKTSGEFFFEPATYSVITPPTTGVIPRHATAILNVKWHTTTT